MLRTEDTVAGNIHHSVAHSRAYEHSYGGNYKYTLERRRLGTYGGSEKIHRIVANSNHQVENSEHEQKDDYTEKQYIHIFAVK